MDLRCHRLAVGPLHQHPFGPDQWQISGAPGAYAVSVTASDGQGASASQSFTWSVSTLSVTNPGTHNGAVGDGVSLQIQSGGLPSGDSWTYAATGLPSGLSINTSSGQIGGTITGSAKTYSVSVTASDGQGARPARASPGMCPLCR